MPYLPSRLATSKSSADLQKMHLARMETKMLNVFINLPLIFDNSSSTAIKVCSRVRGIVFFPVTFKEVSELA